MKLFHKRGRGGLETEKNGVEEEEQMGKVVELKKIMVLYQIWHCVVLAGVRGEREFPFPVIPKNGGL